MKIISLLLSVLLPAFNVTASAQTAQVVAAAVDKIDSEGIHGFDFQVGDWRVHHRTKRANGTWVEFDGTCSNRRLMDGRSNVENHRFDKVDGVTYGVAVRGFDAKTGTWAIWWLDSRDMHATLDPPVKGRFENGVGTFYSESEVNGKVTRTRFIWSHLTATTAHWEQAYSTDAGKTWETNWVMEFTRTAASPKA